MFGLWKFDVLGCGYGVKWKKSLVEEDEPREKRPLGDGVRAKQWRGDCKVLVLVETMIDCFAAKPWCRSSRGCGIVGR